MSGGGEIAGGAVQGAAAGYSVGGPIGAAVGGVIGAIGGLFGSKASRARRRARRLRKQAAQIRHMNERNLAVVQGVAQLSALRSAAGTSGIESSVYKGMEQSVISQMMANIKGDNMTYKRGLAASKQDEKAQRYAGYANLANSVVSAASSIAGSFGGGPARPLLAGPGPSAPTQPSLIELQSLTPSLPSFNQY